MPGITPAQDVTGLGRLGFMKVARRSEEREERKLGIVEDRAEQQYKLGDMQIKQMETNLQTVKKQEQLKRGLGLALQNPPEGENQFTTAYNYFMMSGAPEEALKFMDNQSERIEQIYKMDPERGIDAYNQTIGKISGSTLEYEGDDKKYGKVFESINDKTGDSVWMYRDGDEFKEIAGYSPIPKEGEKPELKNKNLIVIDSIADKVKKGTATPEEIQTYKLAEQDYTQPRITTDSVTGERFMTHPTLPKGMPTFQGEEEGTEPQKPGHKEPLLSKGDFTLTPISDPTRLSKGEVGKYRTAANSLYLMKDMLTELRDDIDKNGVFSLDLGVYADRKSRYWDIMMRYKEVLNLGVLNGPDIEVMSNILKSPADAKSIALGKKWILPGYQNVLDSLDRELNRMYDVTGGLVGDEKGQTNTAEDYLKKFEE